VALGSSTHGDDDRFAPETDLRVVHTVKGPVGPFGGATSGWKLSQISSLKRSKRSFRLFKSSLNLVKVSQVYIELSSVNKEKRPDNEEMSSVNIA
jgi:hypothetical protein